MKLAVIGLYYAPNLGDAVICDCVEYLFRQAYPEAEIHVIDITGGEKFEKQQPVSMRTLVRQSWNLKRDCLLTRAGISDRVYYWKKLDADARAGFYRRTAEQGYDAAVFAGGQLFMDWLGLDICGLVREFRKAGTPVYFNACGAGFSLSKEIRRQLGQALKSENVRWISTRDDRKAICGRYELPRERVIRTFDPALWSAEVYEGAAEKTPYIGLGVMQPADGRIAATARFWRDVIRELDRRGYQWRMFCNGAIDDYHYGKYVLKKAGKDPEKYLEPYPERPEELVRQITGFRALISFRLHSHIIAASFGIPAVALVWDDKLRFFYRGMGHEERCLTIKASGKQIADALEKARTEGVDPGRIREQRTKAWRLLKTAFDQTETEEQHRE